MNTTNDDDDDGKWWKGAVGIISKKKLENDLILIITQVRAALNDTHI